MTTEISSGEHPNPLDALHYASGTDIGRRREENQDSFGIILNDQFHFYIVADGMGGVKGGAVASKLAIERFTEVLSEQPVPDEATVVEAIREANRAILKAGSEDGSLSGMGTTLVGLGFVGTKLYILNVGDSRAYRVRNAKCVQLTQDHTLISELIQSGAITEAQAENHPVSHMLTRSLGPTPAVDPDCFLIDDGPARGDRYLLCSDGLYNLVSEQEICSHLHEYSLEQAKQKLIDLANDRGGTDNITVVIVEVGAQFPIGVDEFAQEEASASESDESTSEDTLKLDRRDLLKQFSDEGYSSQVSGAASGEETPVISGSVDFSRVSIPSNEEAREESEEQQAEEPRIELSSERGDPRRSSRGLLLGLSFFSAGLLVAGVFLYQTAEVGRQPPEPSNQVVRESVPAEEAKTVLPPELLDRVASSPEILDQQEQPLAEEPLTGDSLSSPSEEIARSETPVGANGQRLDSMLTLYDFDSTRDELALQRQILTERVDELEQQISSFGKPLTGELGAILGEAARELNELEQQLEGIRATVEVATRKLAVWYGRRKRLQVAHVLKLTNEVAISSEIVQERKEDFDRATWEYLKEAEALRYDPSNEEKKQQVAKLTQIRQERLTELESAVRVAIDREIGKADQRITELTLKRDRIQSDIEALRRRHAYAKILMHGTPEQKAEKQRSLQVELEIARAELLELEDIGISIPDSAELQESAN